MVRLGPLFSRPFDFVGHYGPAFAAKGAAKRVPLWLGLWRHLLPSLIVEFVVLIGGVKLLRPSAAVGALWVPASGLPPTFVYTALAAYLGLKALAALVYRARKPAQGNGAASISTATSSAGSSP